MAGSPRRLHVRRGTTWAHGPRAHLAGPEETGKGAHGGGAPDFQQMLNRIPAVLTG